MAFRINKGIFQFSDGTKFINKFKIDDNSGALVEVDPETGDPVDGYLKTSDKATDADKLDGINSSSFLRSDTSDSFTGGNFTINSSGQYRVFHAKATRAAGLGTGSAGSNTPPFLFENTGGDQAWGVVAEFRLNEDNRGGDSPAILFSDAQQSTQWTVGFDYTGSEFGIRKNRGIYSGSWGTSYMKIDTSGNTWFYGDVQIGGKFNVGARTGTWLTSNQMSDSIGWNGNHGVYIGSDTSGSSTYVYGDGTFYKNGNNYELIHAGNIGSQSVSQATNADTVDGSHRHEMGNREFTKQGFYVDGDENTYYPVVFSPRNGYAFNRWSISRRYNWTAPYDPIGTGSHKAGLTFDFYWAADTAWGGNDKNIRIHQFSEQYTTTVGGIKLARTGGVVVWLRGGHAYYELQTDNSQTSITPHYDTWTDGSGLTYSPTGDANEYRDTIWNNYPVRNSGELFLSNHKVATEAYVTGRGYITSSGSITGNASTATTATYLGSYYHADTWIRAKGDSTTVKFYGNSRMMVFRTDGEGGDTGHTGYAFKWTYGGDGTANTLMLLDNNGNVWTKSYGWLHSKFDAAGSANTVNERIDTEVIPAISTAQTTADNAATAAANAQTTANTALARADGAREDTVAIGELATAAQAAADAAQATADSKLGATAKAADSNLLDGIDSSAFLRSNVNDTMTANLYLKYNTADSDDYNALSFAPYSDAAGMNDYIIKASSSRGVFGRKSFGWHIHTNSAFGVYSNGWTKLFGVEGGTGNAFATGNFTANNISTNQVFMQSITSDGTIANDKGSYLHLGGWAVGRTHASAVLVNTAYRADYATNLWNENISRFTNDSGYITQSSIDTFAEEVRGEIQTAQTTADNAAAAAAAAQSTADGKLGATAKAADSNLLDGVDSSRFVYGGNATKTTNISNVSTALASGFYDGYNITGSPTGTWYTYINMRHNNTGNNYGSQIAVSFYSNADMYVRTISNGTYQGWSKIWNSANFDPSSKASTSDVTTAQITADDAKVRANNAQASADAAQTTANTAVTNAATANNTANGANARIDDEVLPQVIANATAIETNRTEISNKLNATAKAADSSALDGLGWGSAGKNVRATEFYADNWFRNYNSGEGLYNQATSQHWYSDGDDYWNIAGGTSFNAIRFRDEHGGTQRGLVGADNSNRIGFLDAGGSWAVRHDNDSGTLFYTDNETLEFRVGRDKVTGDYGTVQTDTSRNGWGGYSIYGQYVLMSNGSRIGIYNDIDNEWMLQCHRNAQTELYHNGSRKLYTNSGGINVEGTVTATSFSGSGAGLTNLNVPDQSIPVQINGEGGEKLVSMNMNLDMGQIEFTLTNGQTFTAMMGR